MGRYRRGRLAPSELHDRRAPAAPLGRRVSEVGDEGMAREHGANDRALHPAAASVDQAHLAEATAVDSLQIVGDHGGNIGRREGVQVERILDGDGNGLGRLYSVSPPPTCSCQCW